MDITQIPFNKFIGIRKCPSPDKGQLMLQASEQYTNHLNTVHASAQFALGEAASGEFLLQRFKNVVDKMVLIPVVRKSGSKIQKGRQRRDKGISEYSR